MRLEADKEVGSRLNSINTINKGNKNTNVLKPPECSQTLYILF